MSLMNIAPVAHASKEITPVFEKLDFLLCILHKKNPNSNGPGELYALGSEAEISVKAKAGFKRICAAFSLQSA